MQRYFSISGLILLGLVLVFIDFFSKAYVYHILPFVDSYTGLRCFQIPIFKDFLGVDFSIALAFNQGAAWGMFADFQSLLVALRIFLVLGMFIYLFFINTNRWSELPLVLIISGAVGNIVDFFLYGFVVDFLSFNLWGYNFPIFNLADTWITIGVIGLLLVAALTKPKEHNAA